jgi:transcriptional regulator with XRE-family HTH domain
MFGLGKTRSKFGKWLDRRGIQQNEVAIKSGLGRTTISNMANDKEYKPKFSTFAKLQKGLKKMGYNIEYHDFWM